MVAASTHSASTFDTYLDKVRHDLELLAKQHQREVEEAINDGAQYLMKRELSLQSRQPGDGAQFFMRQESCGSGPGSAAKTRARSNARVTHGAYSAVEPLQITKVETNNSSHPSVAFDGEAEEMQPHWGGSTAYSALPEVQEEDGPQRVQSELGLHLQESSPQALSGLRKRLTVRMEQQSNEWFKQRQTLLKKGPDPRWQEACPGGVINPTLASRRLWELFLLLLVVMDAMIIPFQFAFKNAQVLDAFDGMWLLIVTTSFGIEVGLRFFTAYRAAGRDQDLIPGTMVVDRARIARKYMSGWFWMDLFSTIPWPWIAMVIDRIGGSNAALSDFVICVRALRLLRLLRLAKFFGKSGVWDSFEKKMTSFTLHQLIGLLRVTITMACVCHWNACLWWMIGRKDCPFLHFLPEAYKKYFESLPHWTGVEAVHPDGTKWSWIDQDISSSYMFCFYWTLGVMRTMPTEVFPVNVIERSYVLVFMFLAFSIFGCTVAQVVAIFNKVSERERGFKEEMIAARSYMNRIQAPDSLQDDVLSFLKHLFSNHQIRTKEMGLLHHLPEHLVDELKYAWVKPHLQKVCIFRQVPDELLGLICEISEVQNLSHGFILSTRGAIAEGAWLVLQGHVRVLMSESEGDLSMVDEECLLARHATQSPFSTVAITCCQVIWVQKGRLIEIMNQNPDLSECIRIQAEVASRASLAAEATDDSAVALIPSREAPETSSRTMFPQWL